MLTTFSVCQMSPPPTFLCLQALSIAYMYILLTIIDGIVLVIMINVLCVVCQKFMVGLNFANEQEAERFGNAVETKINERQEKKRANSK